MLVCFTEADEISGELRMEWMREICEPFVNAKISVASDDLPQDKEPSRIVSRIWSDYLLENFGKFDFIFSSEIYGDYMAEYMDSAHIIFDPERNRMPVSSRKIRSKPFEYWDFLPLCVRAYYAKRICILGAESTGTTTMAKELAGHYNTVWVPEF